MSSPSMNSGSFDWKTGKVVFWDLGALDESRPLAGQTEHLKEDLAQVEYPAGIILDVGWYPEFAATGNFVVCVVQQGDWEQPLFRKSAFTTEELKASIIEGIRVAAEAISPPLEAIDSKVLKRGLPKLTAFLNRIPTVKVMSSAVTKDAHWWVKLEIDLDHHLTWSVVQELSYVLNYMSVQERLPTVFMPVSPPSYLNGGPREFLAWVIESNLSYVDPVWIAEALEGRLPQPVDDETKWRSDQDA